MLSSSGEGRRDESVRQLIGELMVSWEVIQETGVRSPHVDGYAAFVARYREDAAPRFRGSTPGLTS